MQMNRIELAGYLGGDPQSRFLGSGTKVVTVRLAESYRFTGRDQKPRDTTLPESARLVRAESAQPRPVPFP